MNKKKEKKDQFKLHPHPLLTLRFQRAEESLLRFCVDALSHTNNRFVTWAYNVSVLFQDGLDVPFVYGVFSLAMVFFQG